MRDARRFEAYDSPRGHSPSDTSAGARPRAARGALALALLLPLAAWAGELPKGVTARSLGKFKATYYWVTCEHDAKGERDTELQDPRGRSLGKFRAEFVKHLKVEGTGRTLEGKTLNWAGEGRFELVKHPWGTGAKAVPLVPFRSLAVDKKEIPIGTRIFIPEAVGALLPDGSVHDGVFQADDTGSAIKGKRIDVFSGLKEDMKILQGRGIHEVELFTLEKDERKPQAEVKFPRPGRVRFPTVAVRVEPDQDAEANGSLAKDEEVKVLGRRGAWLELGPRRFVEAAALDLRPKS